MPRSPPPAIFKQLRQSPQAPARGGVLVELIVDNGGSHSLFGLLHTLQSRFSIRMTTGFDARRWTASCRPCGPDDPSVQPIRRYCPVMTISAASTGTLIWINAPVASTLFLAIYSTNPKYVETHSESRHFALWTGVLAPVYAVWMLYAAGPKFVLLSTIIFAVGIPAVYFAQRENGKPMFMISV